MWMVVFFTCVRIVMLLMMLWMVKSEKKGDYTPFEKWRLRFVYLLIASNLVDIWIIYTHEHTNA
jgi:hypothetical protein